jgi:pimeloyl-ACP methyl ester carboxylesterase
MTTTGPEEETLQIDGRRIRVRSHGVGRPVLLLNGIGAPLETWRPLERRLTGVRTIAFDTLGSGRSQSPRGPLPISGHARLALRVLDDLGYGTVSALGLSFGGMVAQELARLGPERVDRLVLASTSCGWGGVPGPAALVGLAAPEAYFAGSLAGLFGRGPDGGGRRPAIRPGSQPGWAGRHRLGHLHQFWAAATWSSAPWLHRVRQPALVVTGDTDPIVPAANGEILAALLPHGRLHVVRGGGHLCLLERAGELTPLLRAFLLREPPSGDLPG